MTSDSDRPLPTGELPERPPRIALLWRGDPTAPPPEPAATRLHLIFSALADLGVAVEPVIYADEIREAVSASLRGFDGVLVWVDPISQGKDRSALDPILREAAARGVWVSAHPDVILKMGVKQVLFSTRDLGWGADTHLYASLSDFHQGFPPRLVTGPRVLKQNRGNGGLGVWKVELAEGQSPAPHAQVGVQHAHRGSAPEDLTLGDFMRRCEVYFEAGGLLVDQPFQPRLPEGMIRCYLAQGEVVGFGHQLIKALVEPTAGDGAEAALPGPRIMYDADAADFQVLKAKMETEWVPAMQRRLDIADASLPALWDADFLLGPRTADGEDTYVLCEINVSAVAPYPDDAAVKVAQAAVRCVRAAMATR
jgi:hypothetical protein